MSATTFSSSLAAIAARYQGFIIDQWGVLHDGGEPYPGAIDCLTALRETGRRIVLLSNSGKRADHSTRRLAAMGYGAHLFDAVVTSGEACWQALHDRSDPLFADFGRRCILWARNGDRSHVDGLDVEVVSSALDADFLYLAGVKDHAELDPFIEAREIGARRDLPLVCANPDVVAIYPNGGRDMAPGGVARLYESLGGRTVYVGKPHRPVYELCLKHLGDMARDGILGIPIGDPAGNRLGKELVDLPTVALADGEIDCVERRIETRVLVVHTGCVVAEHIEGGIGHDHPSDDAATL
jgi:HAD superfamily hydrolase (TIGR01459 family)